MLNVKYLLICLRAFQVMDYVDTDIAEYIFTTKPQIDLLVKHLCKDLTNSCSKKPPPVPKVSALIFDSHR